MYVKNITLSNYRNYKYQEINFDDGINIIYGKNAQGKTNILESIYLFSTGRSHRTNRDKELIYFGEDISDIKISFVSNDRINTGEIILSGNQKKRIKINEVPINKIGQLMGFFNVIMFSPEDLNIIKEGPSQRRRFIDISISQLKPNYFYNLQQYNKILEQKNRLLKSINYDCSLEDTLPVWNERLIEFGSKIIWYRELFLRKIKEHAARVHSNITKDKEILDIKYIPGFKIDNIESLEQIKKVFTQSIEINKKREIENGISLIGPHRDDIEFYINNIKVKNYASQGQQRTVILSLKMAELEFMREYIGEYPVLLLDDILSELDKERQSYLMNKIENKQVLITCTDVDRLMIYNKAKLFEIENGSVVKGEE